MKISPELFIYRFTDYHVSDVLPKLLVVEGGRLGGEGIEQKGKRTHGHGQQCGDCWVVGAIRGLNGNGEKIQ